MPDRQGTRVHVLGLFAVIATALVGTLVGVRLLRLWLRTRGTPELCAGAGLLLVCAAGHPFTVAGRAPALFGSALGDASFLLGLVLNSLGLTLIHAFTWRVFRPHAGWARALVVAAGVALAVIVADLVHASSEAETLPEILPRTRPWAVAMVAVVAGAFGWTGVEAALHYTRLSRRLALGLADPVVANRFLLWALAGFAVTGLSLVLAGCLWARMVVLREPLPLFVAALAGLLASGAWWLAFLPPPAYLRWLRARATA